MKKTQFLLLCSLCLSCSSQTEKINGVSFVASGQAINKKHIIPVKKISANYIALMPFAFIKDLSSSKVEYNFKKQWFGETKEGVMQYANEFNKAKIKTMVKPQIWVSNGAYTGKIEMASEEKWKILENTYEEFILDYAEIAEKIKADIFCIGTELEKFIKKRPKYWSNLIMKIRVIYSGKLTYAANWDEYKEVVLWSKLDFIGIDAYFPLSDKKSPSLQEYENSWTPYKSDIKLIRDKFAKPILFTEYGYRSVDFNGKEPWNSNQILGQINLENQNKALQSLYNQFWDEDWFAGGFLWKWFHKHEEVGGNNNNRFTPQNKPTETIIKKRYSN